MNNFKKVGLTALAGALVSFSANAVEMSVSGGASIGFTGEEKVDTGNGWSMSDGLTFTGSGELDNGWNVSVKQIIDSSDGVANTIMDTRILTIDMGDQGTLTFSGTGGSSVLNAIDDVTPTAYEESWDIVTSASAIPGGTGGDNMFHYSNSSLMDGVTLAASYTPSDEATVVESSADYGITYTGIDGMTLAAGVGSTATGGAAEVESKTYGVKYATGGFTFGLQMTDVEFEGTTQDEDGVYMGVTYNVNDDFTIGYLRQETDFSGNNADEEHSGIQASYSMGSISFSGRISKVDNMGGSATASDEDKHVTMSIAF